MASKSNNRMNMAIAKVNQLSTRLVGMQLAVGTLIAVGLSMMQLSVGFVFIAQLSVPWQIAAIAGVGALVAILVESLTIGGLGAVRDATTRRKKFLDSYYAMRREPTQQQIENKDRKVQECKKEVISGWSFAGVGIVFSVSLGDLFWHHLFSGLGDWRLVLLVSLMVAAVVTLTFVRTELYHGTLLKILRAILKDNHLMRTAVNEEPVVMQMDMLVSAMSTVRNDDTVRQPIEDKIGRVVRKRLGATIDNFTEVTETADGDVIEGQFKQLPAPRQASKPRGQYQKRKAELQQYLLDNPNAPVRQIAEAFGVSPSTMHDWLDKNRAGV